MSPDRSTGPDPDGTVPAPDSGQDTPDGPGQGEGTPDGSPGVSAPADDQGDTGTGDGGTPNGEAAARRRQLRSVEAERDGLRERVERMQRAEIARVAGEHLAVGTDLLDLSGAELSTLLTESGDPDPDAVRAAADTLVRARPGLRRGPTGAEARAGIGQGSGPAPRAGGTSGGGWADALRGGR